MPTSGYRIEVREGAPDGAVVHTVYAEEEDVELAIDLSAVVLAADREHFVCVVAFNEYGEAAPSVTQFGTDVAGEPDLLPSLVTMLRATALSDGRVQVRWRYEEPGGTKATRFLVNVTALSGQTDPGNPVAVVDRVEPSVDYGAIIDLGEADGRWRVEVLAGIIVDEVFRSREAVTGVVVRSDSLSPPTVAEAAVSVA